MKKITLVLLATLAAIATQAKIWRINNDPTKDPHYTTIQNANDAATTLNGDTLHIEPSGTPYAGVNFSKTLVVLGSGYFLSGPGANANLQQNTNTSIINGDCNFLSDANGTGAPNTGAFNARLQGIIVNGALRIRNLSGVLVTKCKLNDIVFENYGTTAGAAGFGVNVQFRRSFISGNVTTVGFTATASLEVTFENNIFSEVTGTGSFIFNLPTTVKGLFRNNTVAESGGTAITLNNFYVSNNIFIALSSLAAANVNNVYRNNIFTVSNAGNGIVNGVNSNVTGVTVTDVFAANPNAGSGDARYQIIFAATNPAFDSGETIGNVITPNCGATGSSNPYRFSGIPGIPTIYSLTVPSTIASGATTITISLSTRGNN